MSLKVINEALGDIYALRMQRKFKMVTSDVIDNLRGGESQGDYNEIIEIYNLGVDNLHLKLVMRTDSYGDGEFVHSVQIVTPVIKQVTDFEPINK